MSLVGVFLAASWPLFICPLSEGESSEVDKLIPASSGTRVASGEETPAVAPAAFFAPNMAIGSADLLHDNQNTIILKNENKIYIMSSSAYKRLTYIFVPDC